MVLERATRFQPHAGVSGILAANHSQPSLKPELTDAERRLIAAYTEAALRISRELATFKNPRDRTAILQRINAILRQLDQMTAAYVREDLPERFKDGSALALAELRKLRIPDLDDSFTSFHIEAVQQLADDARLRFGEAIQAVKRSATMRLSEATKEIALQKMIVDQIDGGLNPAKAVKDILQQQGITALQSGSRTWTLEQYAEMVTRSVLADAHNSGAAARYTANGVEFARVIERETACKICQPMRGKVIWLGDPRLRPPYHPHCNGGIAPVTGEVDNPIRSPDDPRIPQVTRGAIAR